MLAMTHRVTGLAATLVSFVAFAAGFFLISNIVQDRTRAKQARKTIPNRDGSTIREGVPVYVAVYDRSTTSQPGRFNVGLCEFRDDGVAIEGTTDRLLLPRGCLVRLSLAPPGAWRDPDGFYDRPVIELIVRDDSRLHDERLLRIVPMGTTWRFVWSNVKYEAAEQFAERLVASLRT